MKRVWILLAAAVLPAALPAMAQQSFDMKTIDRMGANAKSSANISLDGSTLKMAAGLVSDDKSAKSALANLKSVQVRDFKFDAPGKYNEADLDPLRAYLNAQKWTTIADVKDEKEKSQIYILPLSGDQMGGIAVISAKPLEVAVVLIEGTLNKDDLGKLGGNLGIPNITLDRGASKSDKRSADK